jgi:succinoglycan biosynthesis protein ExoU
MGNSISVIIAAYNCEATIVKCIKSAINQSLVDKVYVVNDCSTDRTLEVINKKFGAEKKVVVLSNKKNMGPSFSRNRALENCDTEWVTILDSDDFLIENRFKTLLSYASDYDIIADDQFRIVESDSTDLTKMLDIEEPQIVDLNFFLDSNITRKNEYRKELGFVKPLLKLSFITQHKLSYKEDMRLGEDFEFYSRLLSHGAKFILIEACGYVAVVRDDSLSAKHSVKDLRLLRDCNLELIKDFNYDTNSEKLLYKLYYSINKKVKWIEFYTSIKKKNFINSIVVLFSRIDVFIFILKNLSEQIKVRFFNEK